MDVTLKVLGCSGSQANGVHPCSFLLGNDVLFDAGSAASLLSVNEQKELRSIFLTHCHLDHIKDLAFIGENIFSLNQNPIHLYGPAPVLKSIKEHFFNDVIWPDFTALPNAQKPVYKMIPIKEGEVVTLAHHRSGVRDLKIESVAVHHPGPTFGYLITGEERAVVYAGDTGPTDNIWRLVDQRPQVRDIFVETTFPNRLAGIAKDSQHLTAEGLKKELAKIKRKDIKVHIYHIKVPYFEEVAKEVKALGDSRIRLLNPGDSFEIC